MIAVYARALAAGVVALVVNFLILGAANQLGIATARGGFQRLLKLWAGPALHELGFDRAWSALHLPDPGSALFIIGFKIAVGLGMAVVYLWLKSYLPGPALAKGLLYALTVWLINAGLVLPALGQGFAGVEMLSVAGIVVFAIAHTSFFVVLAAML